MINHETLMNAEHRPLGAWIDNPPEWGPFGAGDCTKWNRWVLVHASNLPPRTTMAVVRTDDGNWVYELRGRALTRRPGPSDYSFTAYYEISPRNDSLHLGRGDVHEMFEGNGIGGALFATPLAAGSEAGLDRATVTTAEKGTSAWLPYKPDLDWDTMVMGEFGSNLAGIIRRNTRIDGCTRDDLITRIDTEDPDLLCFMLDHDDLQERGGKRGHTLAVRMIRAAGAWSGVIDLNGPALARVFDEIEARAAEGKQPFVKWRPTPETAPQGGRRLG